MTQAERSLLFYVLDLIKLAPTKYDKLLPHVNTEEELTGHTQEYQKHIELLSTATSHEDAVRLADIVRSQIL
jgi:hypothetical protein